MVRVIAVEMDGRVTIRQMMQLALQHHHAGRLMEAEKLYRGVLAQDPNYIDALGMLGAIAAHTARHEISEQLFTRAIQLKPGVAEYHLHLAHALHALGKFDAAASSYQRGLALKPDSAQAWNNLGLALRECGKLDDAIAAYAKAIALDPNNVDAHNNLGIVLSDQEKLDDAIAAHRRAIELDPKLAEAHFNLGVALKKQDQLQDAMAAYEKAIELRPDYAEAYNNLGIALSDDGKLEEAVAAYSKAIAIKPAYAPAHYNLGNTLRADGKLDEAIAAYTRAIQHRPEYVDALNNLGGALCEQKKLDLAMGVYSRVLRIKPAFAEGYYNRGMALSEQGKLDEAIAEYEIAIQLKRDFTAAHQSRGNVLSQQGKLDEAVASFTHVTEIEPDYAEAHNALGNALKDQGKIGEALAAYERAIELMPDVSFHSNLIYATHFSPDYGPARIYQECRRWNSMHAERFKKLIQPHTNDRDPDRRLKIGYLSPDLGMHPVGRFLVPLLQNHDHTQFEIFCYSDLRVPDEITQRLRAGADVWRSTVGMSDEKVARLIRQDGIDILVELSMHTAGHRLIVFAQKPAPVQVTYLGYCSTTGLDTMDFRLSDIHMDPPGQGDEYYSEKTIRLPETYFCYDPGLSTPDVNPLPALTSGHITFGCLNNFAKVSPVTLSTWCRILQQAPGSRLVLSAKEGSHRRAVSQIMMQGSVDPNRVIFLGRTVIADYFKLYHSIDVGLDPFPFAGGTTTCDMLWMGIPLITLAGETAVGRAGVSLLSNVGLTESVAHSQEDYVRLAVELASDLPRLTAMRAGLRARMLKSPVMAPSRFARNVEGAYRQMWVSYAR